MTEDIMTDFDVAVVGGGPAGTSAANRLACLGRSVLLLEGSSYNSPRVGETLPPSIYPTLVELGVWEPFQSLGSIPSYGTQSIWGDSEILSNPFVLDPYGLGWHVDRLGFDSMLARKASDCGACVMTDVRVTMCGWVPRRGWRIEFQVNKNKQVALGAHGPSGHFYTKGLIDATGRNSILSKRLGGNRMIYDCLSGIAVQFKMRTDVEIGAFTLVEATEEGWWYSAPVPGSRLIVIFMTDLDLVTRNKPMHIDEWLKRLFGSTKHTSARCLGHSILWGPRIFSAMSQRLSMPSTEGKWLATGDAAMAVDPLSSSGIHHALLSGSKVATAMDHWLDGDQSMSYTYENKLDIEFKEYLLLRHNYYSMETRWPDAEFWKRRQSKKV
jgi:flavin-dependent dehydrogenase